MLTKRPTSSSFTCAKNELRPSREIRCCWRFTCTLILGRRIKIGKPFLSRIFFFLEAISGLPPTPEPNVRFPTRLKARFRPRPFQSMTCEAQRYAIQVANFLERKAKGHYELVGRRLELPRQKA